MFNAQCSMFNCKAVARTCICCRRNRCKSCKQVRERSGNVQLRSSRENLHLLSAKPVQILQTSSRAKRQCSMFNAQCSMLNVQCSTAQQSRELAFAVGEAGANLASKFESEAAMFNCKAVARTYICCRRSRCKSCKQVRERSGNVQRFTASVYALIYCFTKSFHIAFFDRLVAAVANCCQSACDRRAMPAIEVAISPTHSS